MLNAVVIPFPNIPATRLQADAVANGPAQIIIFPGVRYIHVGEAAEDLFAIATAPLKNTSRRKK